MLADIVTQVHVLRLGRVGGRVRRIRARVAERARHADHVRPFEVLVVVVGGILVVPLGVPPRPRRRVEARIREESQPHDPAGPPVGAGVDPRVEVVARLARDINEQTVRVGLRGPQVSRLVHHAEFLEPLIAAPRDDLEEIRRAVGIHGQPVPKPCVVARPQIPHDAALQLVGRELDGPSVEAHPGEWVERHLLELPVRPARCHRDVGASDHHAHEPEEEQDEERGGTTLAPRVLGGKIRTLPHDTLRINWRRHRR